MASKYIPSIGKGSKAVIGAMGDGAKGKIVMRDGKVVESTVDASKDEHKGKHRKEDS